MVLEQGLQNSFPEPPGRMRLRSLDGAVVPLPVHAARAGLGYGQTSTVVRAGTRGARSGMNCDTCS